MRDLLLTVVALGAVPFVIANPWMGSLLYAWLSVMNPQWLAFSYAQDIPFAMIAAIATFLGIVLSTYPKRFPVNALTVTLLFFVFWLIVTMIFALEPEKAFPLWLVAMKNLLMYLVALMLLREQRHVDLLVAILCLSIGFYCIKGGLFTIATGGEYRVYGPGGGATIGENNSLAVATIMAIPLMRYLQLHGNSATVPYFGNKWVKRGWVVAMGLSAVSALGSQSRGALLAIVAMGLFFWWKSRHKFILGIMLVAVTIGGLAAMSERWEQRMETISTYEDDGSAQGRLHAWQTMFNIAVDRPLVGGGFMVSTREVYVVYSADPSKPWNPVAHSIYFQVLGEHGFVGLGLFLLLWILSWRTANRIIKAATGRDNLTWARDLAAMIQASFVAYAVGGAFLNLAHFDLPYYMLVLIVVLEGIVTQSSRKAVPTSQKTLSPGQKPAASARF